MPGGDVAEQHSTTTTTNLPELGLVVEQALVTANLAMNYIEIKKLNSYVEGMQRQEAERLAKTKDTMADSLMVTQRMFLMQTRERDRLASRTRLLMYTMVALCLFFALLPPFPAGSAVVALGYLACLILYFRNSNMRRYDDWDKLYWSRDFTSSSGDAADGGAASPGAGEACGGDMSG